MCTILPAQALTVVELFTSQGCPSCPAAEAYLEKLSHDKNIISLAYHVDYWNRDGWTDPYSDPDFTQRQYDYSNTLNQPGRVYTPQFVVNGHRVGKVPLALTMPVILRVAKNDLTLPVTLKYNSHVLEINIPKSAYKNAIIWLVSYTNNPIINVKAGANKGRKMSGTHVVRAFTEIGIYQGKKTTLSLATTEVPDTDFVAVLVQSIGPKRILGAAKLNLN